MTYEQKMTKAFQKEIILKTVQDIARDRYYDENDRHCYDYVVIVPVHRVVSKIQRHPHPDIAQLSYCDVLDVCSKRNKLATKVNDDHSSIFVTVEKMKKVKW